MPREISFKKVGNTTFVDIVDQGVSERLIFNKPVDARIQHGIYIVDNGVSRFTASFDEIQTMGENITNMEEFSEYAATQFWFANSI